MTGEPRRYLVLIPARLDRPALFEQLQRLGSPGRSRFHVVVVPDQGGDHDAEADAGEQRLQAIVGTLVQHGLTVDGEIGVSSIVGSVARATERDSYDVLVVPVPETGGLGTLDLDVARRLHQIDIPELVLLTPL